MAYVVQRGDRFTSYYRHAGKRCSAGTYDSRAEAERSGTLAELLDSVPMGKNNASTIGAYFDRWIEGADLMPITKKNYTLLFNKYIRIRVGDRSLEDIRRANLLMLLSSLKAQGVPASTRSQIKACIGSMYRSVLEEGLIQGGNPSHGITITQNQPNIQNVLEPEDFKKILANLLTQGEKLLAQFLVSSGCRFGEATEIRVKDFNFTTGEVYVQRRVSDLGASHNNGKRFKVIEGTKSGRKRSVTLSKALIHEIEAYVTSKSLRKDDLLFPRTIVLTAGKLESSRGTEKSLGSFSKDGKLFQHGTLYAYTHGACRCQTCGEAVRKYRQSKSKQKPMIDDTSHLPREVWRNTWNKAIAKSGIGWTPRTHDLRHANATQLLKNGVDLHEVKERLGHQSIKTTERYLHRIRHQQSTAGELTNDFME